jgi:hypothetical protein
MALDVAREITTAWRADFGHCSGARGCKEKTNEEGLLNKQISAWHERRTLLFCQVRPDAESQTVEAFTLTNGTPL